MRRIALPLLLAALAAPLRADELSEAAAGLAAYGAALKIGIPARSGPRPREGARVLAFDVSSVDGVRYYVNDHTVVKGRDGKWHLFGIYRKEPFTPYDELEFVHAVHDGPLSYPGNASFSPAGTALRADASIGETHLWAPHIAADGGRWVMAYQSGGPAERSQLRLAESADLEHWRRIGSGPAFEDICVARDPMLLKIGDLWVLYYTRCDDPVSLHSGVAFRTSSDLRSWSEPRMALVLRDTPPMGNSGYTESPFVFQRGGSWYLSVTSYPVSWDATFLYRSDNPFSFSGPPIARLTAHAAEWVTDDDGRLLMTHCGAGQTGVWLAPVAGF